MLTQPEAKSQCTIILAVINWVNKPKLILVVFCNYQLPDQKTKLKHLAANKFGGFKIRPFNYFAHEEKWVLMFVAHLRVKCNLVPEPLARITYF